MEDLARRALDAEDFGVRVVGQKLIYGCVVIGESNQRAGLLSPKPVTVPFGEGGVELFLLIVDYRLEADLSTT